MRTMNAPPVPAPGSSRRLRFLLALPKFGIVLLVIALLSLLWLLQRNEYIQPKDASNDGLFAAHHANKTAAKYAVWQLDMIEQLMQLSDASGKPIKIHGGAENVH